MSKNHQEGKKTKKEFLQNPTEKEKKNPVYENADVKIFPHTLTEYNFSCPQYAVFRIVSERGVRVYMSISWNRYVCAVPKEWQEVFDEFLVFARVNKYVAQDLALADFFKNAPGQYRRQPMEFSPDLFNFVEEVQPLSPLSKALQAMPRP